MTQDSTQTDQLYLLYRQMPGTALSTSVTAVVTAAVLMSVLPISKLVPWLTAVLLLNATRYFLAIIYAAQDPSTRQTSRWKWCALITSAVNGILWGALAVFTVLTTSFVYQAFIAAVLLGMAAMATAMTAYILSVYLAFIIPTLIPLTISFYLSGDSNIYFGASVLLGLAFIVLSTIAWNVQRSFKNSFKIVDKNNQLVYGLKSEIQERTQTELNLRRLIEHNRLLLESTGEGIFGIDTNGRCTFVNHAGLAMLGYRMEEITQADMHKLTHHTHADGTPYPKEECPVYQAYQHGRSSRVNEEVLWRKNGSSFPVEYSVSPVIDEGTITGAVVMFRDVTESQAMAKQLDYLANHDALTSLHNRQAFERKLQELLGTAQIDHVQHVLCYIDLDQFKIINDTCGHIAGDELLRQLANLLVKNVRHSDFLARLGGDEFGLLLSNCSLDQAVRSVDKIVESIRGYRFSWENNIFVTGVSIGIVEINETTESAVSALIKADSACYMAKDSGRNRIHIYRADDTQLAKRQGEMQWVSQIHEALEDNRFYLLQQSIEAIHSNGQDLCHFEILLRMRDIEDNCILPGTFLPAAERYNLMPEIDRWVVRTVFTWLHENPDILKTTAFCTINLSGHTFSDETFLSYVVEHLWKFGIPGHKICFEVTETAAVANFSQATKLISELKKYGCLFALDDFGSGMSSFAYLKNLEVDFLKIDGNFIKDIHDNPTNYAIVESIHKVAQVMAIQTIAEFVENDEIRQTLKKIGVNYAQGYAISKPQPLEIDVSTSSQCKII
ncbi:MAG: EAL domain-containing protein [Gammaproteobacteria bacterium]